MTFDGVIEEVKEMFDCGRQGGVSSQDRHEQVVNELL